jgi:hypothetical protein
MREDIAAEYKRIQRRALEDPGTAGDEGEGNWANLLQQWLPGTYHVVTKGRILGLDGSASPQVDVLVLSPHYPSGLLENKLYLAAGVLAAFECKITLRSGHIREAMKTSIAIRAISKATERSAPEHIVFGLLAHSHAWRKPRSRPVDNVSEALSSAAQHVQWPSELLDMLCIADLGTWALMKITTGAEFSATYMGPLDPKLNPYEDPQPIGRMVTYLLRRMGRQDKALTPIARYFDQAGLFGVGVGAPRHWDANELPEDERELIW